MRVDFLSNNDRTMGCGVLERVVGGFLSGRKWSGGEKWWVLVKVV